MNNTSYLEQIAAEAGLNDREVNLFAAVCNTRQFNTGEMIMTADKLSPEIFLLVEGVISVFQEVAHDRRVEHFSLEPVSLVGPLATSHTPNLVFDYVAKEAALCLTISRDDLHSMERAQSPLSSKLLCFFYREVARVQKRHIDCLVGFHNIPGKTVARLRELSPPPTL
ncbi:MAG: hypothetical protein CMH54_13410 [Myxococcales bacterium]|nr:hypothetical protein [Myxococcales bacterium]